MASSETARRYFRTERDMAMSGIVMFAELKTVKSPSVHWRDRLLGERSAALMPPSAARRSTGFLRCAANCQITSRDLTSPPLFGKGRSSMSDLSTAFDKLFGYVDGHIATVGAASLDASREGALLTRF